MGEFIDISDKKEHKIPLGKTPMGEAILYAKELKDKDIAAKVEEDSEKITVAVDNQSELETMILANTSMQVANSADVLYELDGTAITNEDGTRELKNKALHSDTPNGKLFSGNPLDFQGSQAIESATWSDLGFSHDQYKFTVVGSVARESSGIVFTTGYTSENGGLALEKTDTYMRIGANTSNDGYLSADITEYTKESIDYAVTFNNGVIVLYLDNVEVATSTISNSNVTFFVSNGLYVGAYRGTSQFFDGTQEYIAFIGDAISDDEIKRFSTEPEKALIDYGTNNDFKGVFVTDFSGDSEVISNMCDFDTSGNLQSDTAYSISPYPENDSTSEFSEDSYVFSSTNKSSVIFRVLTDVRISDLVVGDVYYIECWAKCNSSSMVMRFRTTTSRSISNVSDFKTLETVGGYTKFKGIFTVSDYLSEATGDLSILMCVNDVSLSDIVTGEIKRNIVIKKLQGIHQIQGYQETQRTNFIQQSKGYQHGLVNRNELGFTDGIFNGFNPNDSILDTNFRPDGEFSLEFIYQHLHDGKRHEWGVEGSGESRFKFNKHINNDLYCYFGNIYDSTSILKADKYANQFIHIVVVVRATTYKIYINGEYHYGNEHYKTEDANDTFKFGKINNESPYVKFTSPNFTRKLYTDNEVKTLHRLRQKEYPTLNIGAK